MSFFFVTLINTWEKQVDLLKKNIYSLYLASLDKRVPWAAKLMIALVVGYAASPIDLIPDFIPIIGLLDDLVLVPLGIYIAIRLIPNDIWMSIQQNAIEKRLEIPSNKTIIFGIIIIWLIVLLMMTNWLIKQI